MLTPIENERGIPNFTWEPGVRPDREMVELLFQKVRDDTYKLTMLIPLDSSYAEEEEAARLFGSGTRNILTVRSVVTLDFEAQKNAFTTLLNEMYASEIGQALSKKELQQITQSDLRSALKPLVDQGLNVFHRLLISETIVYENHTESDMQLVRAAIKSAFSRPQVLSIFNDSPMFPWAFLYYDEGYDPTNRSTIKPERFWGFMHEIQEDPGVAPQRIHLSADPEIILAVDGFIDDTGAHDAEDHPFSRARTKPVPDTTQLGEALTNFEAHCLYFFGHADHANPPAQTTSWLELLENKLSVSDLNLKQAPKFRNNPVVAFLNGCNTSPLTKWNEDSVVGFLCIRGKNQLCCIASVGKLPASFALEFGKEFWEKFLTGLPIGTALLLARQYMLQRWNSPLGLLYSLFGRVDTNIPQIAGLVGGAQTHVVNQDVTH